MNTLNYPLEASDSAHARVAHGFAIRVAAYLSEGADELPHDIGERLRIARLNAVAKHKAVHTQSVKAAGVDIHLSGGAASLAAGGPQGEDLGIWGKLASLMPIAALIVALFMVNQAVNDDRARELAEVDSALLTDDLPPSAYLDSGFAHFLKVSLEP